MTAPIRIAVVGMGKIAHDQHLPAIARSSNFELAATVSRHGAAVDALPLFHDLSELAASDVQVDAVSLCTPPQARRQAAAFAIERGWHIFLEKPPGATLAEVAALTDQAEGAGVSLFASWHSRFAPGVELARTWLAEKRIKRAAISWREDVRHWHPGQDWIFEPGGFGVFDPGINALSIATRVLSAPIVVETAEIDVPGNRGAPIAARVGFRDLTGAPVEMELDFLQKGEQSWDIRIETDDGDLELTRGGHFLAIDGSAVTETEKDLHGEYTGLYRRFAAIVRAGVSDVDVAPLRLVADAFLRARIRQVADFEW